MSWMALPKRVRVGTRAVLAAGALGWLGIASPLRSAEKPIELPPFIVESSTNSRPWRYASASGMEVLARCNDETTTGFIQRNIRLEDLLRSILPESLQFETAVPKIVILAEADDAPGLSKSLVDEFAKRAPPSRPPDLLEPDLGWGQIRIMPNLELRDAEMTGVFALVDDYRFDPDRLVLTLEHIRRQIELRTPPLPAWFIAGFMKLLGDAQFTRDTVEFPALSWAWPDDLRRPKPDDKATTERRPVLFPALFTGRPGAGEASARWEAEAALFIRWALDPADPSRRAALARFVASGPADDAALENAFHLTRPELASALAEYLRNGAGDSMVIRPPLSPLPRVRLRNATPAEIGRMNAEWERLEIPFVKSQHPDFAPQYIAVARRTIARARARAPQDPGVLTVAALLACDLGETSSARGLLEQAVSTGIVRPRLHVELARMRLNDVLGNTRSHEDHLSLAEGRHILQALQGAFEQPPHLEAAFALAEAVWVQCGATLSDAQMSLVEEGLQRYPAASELLYYSALLYYNRGELDHAIALAKRGADAPGFSPSSHARLTRLSEMLERLKTDRGSHLPEPPR